MGVDRDDLGCWIVKGNGATNPGYIGIDTGSARSMPASVIETTWCLSARTRRPALVRRGDLIALWITGKVNPGIYEFGYVTSDGVVDEPTDPGSALHVDFQAIRLDQDSYVPRAEMAASPTLRNCEQFRAPIMANPSYLTRPEAVLLAELIARRVPRESMEISGWATALTW
jgi:hypothetical protein